jgi:next-to-BRCA1 protein 1
MIESLMTSSQEDIEMPEQEAAEGVAPQTATPQPMEDEAVVQQLVDPFPAADVDILEPVAASKEAEVETAPETVQYPEINMEALTLDAVVVDTAKTQEENTAVENSELGNFSMVNMPFITEIPVEQVEDTVSPRVAFAVDDEPAEAEKYSEMKKTAEEDSLEMTLGALESMGFKQRDLNQELLKKNDYDVQRTVDDLVMAAEWDPMLEELEEMGFYDTDMNRRLMFKNNGSVKRVVKELVQMYKDPKGKEQI